jgi:hypothetical protein
MIETLLLPLLGKELFSKVFSDTSDNIYNGLSELRKYNHYNFDNLIEQLDLETKIKIIDAYIKQIDEDSSSSDAIQISIESIIKIIKKMNQEIKDINTEIEDHKHKWFYSFRTPHLKDKINNLINHSIIFDKRIDLLLKL